MASVTSSKYVIDLTNDSYASEDSFQQRAKAVICILPFAQRKIAPTIFATPEDRSKAKLSSIGDYLNLRHDYIIIVSDILSLSINTSKDNPCGNLSATIAPDNDVDYLHAAAPGDYIFAWITEEEKVDNLIDKIKNMQPCHSLEDRLKFFGQIRNITENFSTHTNGLKTKRYNLTANSFNFYNAQIYSSPVISQLEATDAFGTLFTNDQILRVDQFQTADEKISCHYQILTYHKLFLGVGPGDPNANGQLRTPNGLFAIPINVAKLLGRISTQHTGDYTISDIMSVLVGVQTYTDPETVGELGPNFELESDVSNVNGETIGLYYVPKIPSLELKGKNPPLLTPTTNTTIWNLLKGVSNVSINEMYTTLRLDPNDQKSISPTLVCRQLPYCVETVDDDKFPITPFLSLPRFVIDNTMIMEYSLTRTNDMRINFIVAKLDNKIATTMNNGNNILGQALGTAVAPFAFDPTDVRRHGARMYNITFDDAYLDLAHKANFYIKNYTTFLTNIMSNMQLKYSGTIQTFGIYYPVSIGENLEFNDIVFQIESITHQYQILGNIPVFRTSFNLSHGTHISGNEDELADIEESQGEENLFQKIAPGIQKDSEHPTDIAPSNNATLESSQRTGK